MRDSIAATSLVILLKLDSNRRFFILYDLEIRLMKNNRAPPTSRFVHFFKNISKFKLELQSGNSQFRSKLMIFCPM